MVIQTLLLRRTNAFFQAKELEEWIYQAGLFP